MRLQGAGCCGRTVWAASAGGMAREATTNLVGEFPGPGADPPLAGGTPTV